MHSWSPPNIASAMSASGASETATAPDGSLRCLKLVGRRRQTWHRPAKASPFHPVQAGVGARSLGGSFFRVSRVEFGTDSRPPLDHVPHGYRKRWRAGCFTECKEGITIHRQGEVKFAISVAPPRTQPPAFIFYEAGCRKEDPRVP